MNAKSPKIYTSYCYNKRMHWLSLSHFIFSHFAQNCVLWTLYFKFGLYSEKSHFQKNLLYGVWRKSMTRYRETSCDLEEVVWSCGKEQMRRLLRWLTERDWQMRSLWTMMFTDDIVLCRERARSRISREMEVCSEKEINCQKTASVCR